MKTQTTRTVTPARAFVDRSSAPHPSHFRAAKDAASRMSRHYSSENVARCHKCPGGVNPNRNVAAGFCDTCYGINRARIYAGLIRPRHQEDHANNILYPIPLNKKAKIKTPPARRYGRACSRLVGGTVRRRGGGWYQGVVTLDGFVIVEGPRERSEASVNAWLIEQMSEVSANLEMGIAYDV